MERHGRVVVIFFRLVASLMCLLFLMNPGAALAGKVFTDTGVALTPRNFPNQTPADVEQMFKLGKELGKYAVFIYQWSQPDLNQVAAYVMGQCQKHGLTPIIAISPTVLKGARKEIDAPASVRSQAGKNLSFANPVVHKAYIDAVMKLVQLKPPYLCLATEINLLGYSSTEEYKYFAHIYKTIYPLIKKGSPQTKVFVSFQWDVMRLLDDKEPRRVKEFSVFIDVFRPELDLVAFTSYPQDHYANPDKIPLNYYARIYDHIKHSDQVMFMEIGWPGDTADNYQDQVQFLTVLPKLMEPVKPKFLIWSLLHDVKPSLLPGKLGLTGLITNAGVEKPSFALFKNLRNQ